VELVLGVQFEPIGLTAPHLGLFWQESGLRKRFRQVKQLPALDPVVEKFDGRQIQPPPGMKFLEEPETPRCWFVDETGNELVQLQADRFLHNWRTVDGAPNVYPHFEGLQKPFLEGFTAFSDFAAREGFGDIKPNQCEVTYVNHIRGAGVWEGFGQADRVFPLISAPSTSGPLTTPEDVRFATRYVFGHEVTGEPVGRLHVTVQPGFSRNDGAEIFMLTLLARGAPEGAGAGGVARFMERAHRLIVTSFEQLTSAAMHKVWGKNHAR